VSHSYPFVALSRGQPTSARTRDRAAGVLSPFTRPSIQRGVPKTLRERGLENPTMAPFGVSKFGVPKPLVFGTPGSLPQRRFKPFDETEARSSSAGGLQFGQFPLAVQVSALPEYTDRRLRGAPVSASKILSTPLKPKPVLLIHLAPPRRWRPGALRARTETGTGCVRCLIPILLFGGFGYAHL
jgi:hypothetical protein